MLCMELVYINYLIRRYSIRVLKGLIMRISNCVLFFIYIHLKKVCNALLVCNELKWKFLKLMVLSIVCKSPYYLLLDHSGRQVNMCPVDTLLPQDVMLAWTSWPKPALCSYYTLRKNTFPLFPRFEFILLSNALSIGIVFFFCVTTETVVIVLDC